MKKILFHFLLAIFFIVPSFIEVTGPTGDSLSGWEIILYNEIPLPYDTIILNGEFPGTQACNGIVEVDAAILFTTPGSGMALVDDQGMLIQYLTYGDTTTGTSGPIANTTSENIGTQVGNFGSLQLTGVGAQYQDFTWNLLDTATPDEVNISQLFECILPLVLPVELVEFEGEVRGDNIVLSWMTLSETNHSHFEVLHSTTGVGMEEVGRVYEAKSESELSNIISIVSNRVDEPVKISPNPATNFIDIEIQFENIGLTDEANIMIIDSQGKNVFTKQTSLSELDRISIDFLESGLYVLIVQSGTISKQVKFIKRK